MNRLNQTPKKMKTKAEVLIDQLQEIAENQDSMSEKPEFVIGDIVTLSEEGTEYIAKIEDEDRGVYQVRVLAIAGDEFEPTDKIYYRYAEEIQFYEKAPVVENDVEGGDDDDPLAGEEKSINATDKVSWVSQVGDVKGVVDHVTDNIAHIEVYVKSDDCFESTGVFVDINVDNLACSEFLVKEHFHQILTKMEDVEMSVESNIGRFKGIGSQYGLVDLGGDTVAKGAYTQTMKHKNGRIKLLFDHGWKTKDIAGVAFLSDSDNGLMVDAEMPLDAQDVKDAYTKIKFLIDRGEPVGLSIGYDPVKFQINADGTRTLKEIALHEMSITPFPMDTGAQILNAKSKRIAYKAMQYNWQTIPTDAPLGNQDD